MASLGSFDLNAVPKEKPRNLLPPGNYVVQVSSSDTPLTNDGSTTYLSLQVEIIEGEYTNRKLWCNLYINSASDNGREFAQRVLASLCHATGKLNARDSEELHFIPVIAQVRVQPPKDGYEAKNSITEFKPKNQATAVADARPRVSEQGEVSAPAAAPAAANRPWNRARASA